MIKDFCQIKCPSVLCKVELLAIVKQYIYHRIFLESKTLFILKYLFIQFIYFEPSLVEAFFQLFLSYLH